MKRLLIIFLIFVIAVLSVALIYVTRDKNRISTVLPSLGNTTSTNSGIVATQPTTMNMKEKWKGKSVVASGRINEIYEGDRIVSAEYINDLFTVARTVNNDEKRQHAIYWESTTYVPDSYLAIHAKEILDIVREKHKSDPWDDIASGKLKKWKDLNEKVLLNMKLEKWESELLGKTGSAEALKYLQNFEKEYDRYFKDT